MADEKRQDRLEVKLDKQDERLDEITLTLTEIKADWRDHMRRSLANEEANELTNQRLDLDRERFEKEKKLIDVRINSLELVKSNLQFLGWVLAGLISLLVSLSKLGLV